MPSLHAWTEGDQRLRVLEQPVPKGDKEAKALACYGVRVSCPADPQHFQTRVWLRFVDGRPVSAITTQFLAWTCEELERAGKKVWVLIWDNAPWHVSKAVRAWIRAHNKQVKREGRGARILVCYLPAKSPWLNPIEACWAHAKRCVYEVDDLLTGEELADRVCARFDCKHEPHLTVPDKVV